MLVTGKTASIDSVTDIVSIRDLRVSTVIGVYDWEREIEQALIFSVDLAADVARAAAHDVLANGPRTQMVTGASPPPSR